jgi:hypothetical protein
MQNFIYLPLTVSLLITIKTNAEGIARWTLYSQQYQSNKSNRFFVRSVTMQHFTILPITVAAPSKA